MLPQSSNLLASAERLHARAAESAFAHLEQAAAVGGGGARRFA